MNAKESKQFFKEGKLVSFYCSEGEYTGRITSIEDTSPLSCEIEILYINKYPSLMEDIRRYPKEYLDKVINNPRDLTKVGVNNVKDYDEALKESLLRAYEMAVTRVDSIDYGATGFNFSAAKEVLNELKQRCLTIGINLPNISCQFTIEERCPNNKNEHCVLNGISKLCTETNWRDCPDSNE